MREHEQGKLRIVALPGGGSGGHIQNQLIDAFEEKSGRPLYQQADIMAAISVGIIKAATAWPLRGTGEPLMSSKVLDQFYRNEIPESFRERFLSFGGILDNRYDVSELEKNLDEVFGGLKLSDFEDGLHIYVVDVEGGYVRALKSELAKASPSEDFYMRDVIRAAVAAPTFMDQVQIKNLAGGIEKFTDAGTSVSDPSFLAAMRTEKAHPEAQLVVTSFGTGHKDQEVVDLNDIDKGMRSLGSIWTLQARANQKTQQMMLKERLGDRYVDLDVDISHSGITLLEQNMDKLDEYAQRAVQENQAKIQKAIQNMKGPDDREAGTMKLILPSDYDGDDNALEDAESDQHSHAPIRIYQPWQIGFHAA